MGSRDAMTTGLELLTVEEMGRADRLTAEWGTPGIELMENAGLAIAEAILARWPIRPVLVLCGPGNNGGDATVAGRHVRDAGLDVTEVRPLDGDALPRLDARTLVVDGLFGVGLSRAIEGDAAAANRSRATRRSRPSAGPGRSSR